LPQVEVTFDIDANGIVNVAAKDTATGKEQTITISGSSGLAKNEVERMVKDAEAHAEEDQARRELIEARNQADALIYSVEKTFTESKAKLTLADAKRIEAALSAAKDAVKSDTLATIRSTTTELQQASHAMAEALYKANQGQPSTGTPNDGQPGVKDGEVVDEEFAGTR
jgi:molecular chaperone DnaK